MTLRVRLACMALSGILIPTQFAAAQLPAEKTLALINRTFVCPEDLPNDDARDTANTLFIQLVMSMGEVTSKKIIEFRMRMLRSHGCTKTLDIISKSK